MVNPEHNSDGGDMEIDARKLHTYTHKMRSLLFYANRKLKLNKKYILLI